MLDFKFRVCILSLTWLMFTWCGADLGAQQVVFVDFDSETTGNDHVYTASERVQILDELAIDYGPFFVFFTDTEPSSGDFSTITLNSGPAFGIAEAIDFRNLNRNDNATVDVNSGASNSAEFVTLTTTVVSHELGHLLGLRHGDSFGPLGLGVDSNTVFSDSYLPPFVGPQLADETSIHIMESDILFIENVVAQFFSERSAIRLAFNELGTVVPEEPGAKSSIATAQDIELSNMTVPNTIEFGDRTGEGDFEVGAVVVTGTFSAFAENDFYRIEADAGDILNIEVVSNVIIERLGNPIDPQVTLLDSSGNAVDYFGVPAFNDDEFESFDSILIDLVIPRSDSYFIQIEAFSAVDTGSYELFVTQFDGEFESDLVGDFDNDGNVNGNDIDFYAGNLGSPATEELSQLDLDGDGQITFCDVGIHVSTFVQTSNGQTGTFLGDLNLDGMVDVLGDGSILIGSLGTSVSSYGQGDINLDGIVNVLGDALILVVNLNSSNDDSSPGGGEPEPSPPSPGPSPPPAPGPSPPPMEGPGPPLVFGRVDVEALKQQSVQDFRKRLLPLWPKESGPLDCRCSRCQQKVDDPLFEELP